MTEVIAVNNLTKGDPLSDVSISIRLDGNNLVVNSNLVYASITAPSVTTLQVESHDVNSSAPRTTDDANMSEVTSAGDAQPTSSDTDSGSKITIITGKSLLSQLERIMPERNLFLPSLITSLYGYDCSNVPELIGGKIDLVKFMERPSLWTPDMQMKDVMHIFWRPAKISVNDFADKANEVAIEKKLGIAVWKRNKQARETQEGYGAYQKVHRAGEWVVMPILPAPGTIDRKNGLTRYNQQIKLTQFIKSNPEFKAEKALNTAFLANTLFLTRGGERYPAPRTWLVATDPIFGGRAVVGNSGVDGAWLDYWADDDVCDHAGCAVSLDCSQ